MGAEDFKIGGLPRDIDSYNTGYEGANVSSLNKTTLPQFSRLTVNFAKENIDKRQAFTPNELTANLNTAFGDRAGLGRNIFNPEEGSNLHLVG